MSADPMISVGQAVLPVISRAAKIVNVEYSLRRQAEAAKNLVHGLQESGDGDDAQLIADTVEGETNLIEAIERALAEKDECDIMAAGLKAKEAEFAGRRGKIEKRADRIRTMIEQAMMASEQNSIRLPSATLTLTKRAPGLILSEESAIPAKFWIEQERPAPKLNRKALQEALTANEEVPGASLDNGSISLSVRRK